MIFALVSQFHGYFVLCLGLFHSTLVGAFSVIIKSSWTFVSSSSGAAVIYIRPLHIYTPFVPHYSRNFYVSHFHGIKARFNAAKMIILQ